MHAGYVRISPDITVEEAIAETRQQAGQVEMIYYAYALDRSQHLMGVVSFRELLSAERSRRVREVMHTDYVSVVEDADQETVAQLLAKRRLLAVPGSQRWRESVSSINGRVHSPRAPRDAAKVVRSQEIGGQA